MIKRILCARDFSSASNRALRYALDLTERTGADLHLMHVEEISLGLVGGDPSPAPGERALQEEFETRCRDDVAALPGPTPEDLRLVAKRSGAIAPALVRYANEHDVDLISVGTAGRRGAERFFVGSVAEEVLRTAPCPVLTTRSASDDAPDDSNSPLPASIRRVVAPVDFSASSRAAVPYAARLARTYDVPLILVHVARLPTLPGTYRVEYAGATLAQIRERSRSELEAWAESAAAAAEDVTCRVASGDPVEGILQTASTPEDAVVMATRGLSGVRRMMLGSVAEGVLREATGPVFSSRSFPALP